MSQLIIAYIPSTANVEEECTYTCQGTFSDVSVFTGLLQFATIQGQLGTMGQLSQVLVNFPAPT